MKKEKITVIGAGLSGSLLAIRLAHLGYNVRIFEKREDLRTHTLDSGRSINLALSDRGINALKFADLGNSLEDLLIPMPGRMIHSSDGHKRFSPYSGRSYNFINSISRDGLNAILLDKIDAHPQIEIQFNANCKKVYLAENKFLIEVNGQEEWQYTDIIIGADGAGSVVRHCMGKIAQKREMQFLDKSTILDYGYKELSFPPKNGKWAIESRALHIWPRGKFMMIALPNLDHTFTVTLFLPLKGEDISFEHIADKKARSKFFQKYFPDTIALFDHMHEEYDAHPIGILGTVNCKPWSITDKCLVIGDAAHAMVPFYGQGMNCAFEDIVVLDELLTRYKHHWPSVLKEFSEKRKQDTDAISELAMDNFYEMRDYVDDTQFAKKRAIEMKLESNYDDYFSKYSLVTFREDLPYSIAKEQGRFQDNFLLNLLEKEPEITYQEVYKILKKEFEKHPTFSLTPRR